MEVLRIIEWLVFGSAGRLEVVWMILYIAGLWKIFAKSGVKSYLALVPWVRDYKLSLCAGREPDGRIFCIFSFLSTWVNIAFMVASWNSNTRFEIRALLLTSELIIDLILLIYRLRVFSGLIEVYGVRRSWMWLYIISLTRWIPMIIWGFNSKYQPEWQVEDLHNEMEKVAMHGSAKVMDNGLTVNLQERTVTEFFHKKALLRDIHMSIPQGHMVLLLGGSGAGKTTFLNAVNGYEKAKAEVMLNGTNMYTHYKKMQYEVGFVPQQEMMRGKDTVLNTLLDAAKMRLPREIPASSRRQRVDEVMDIFGLTPVKNNLVDKLSGGQKKRLSISIEYISNPSLFILDEPDSGLDGVMARELFRRLRDVADTGKIVIVITHTPDRVIDLFDDVIVLAKDSSKTGRLAFYGSIDEARKYFKHDKMEEIVKSVNTKEEGGEGLADEYVKRFAEREAEVQYG